jgi:hypothetical protein
MPRETHREPETVLIIVIREINSRRSQFQSFIPLQVEKTLWSLRPAACLLRNAGDIHFFWSALTPAAALQSVEVIPRVTIVRHLVGLAGFFVDPPYSPPMCTRTLC